VALVGVRSKASTHYRVIMPELSGPTLSHLETKTRAAATDDAHSSATECAQLSHRAPSNYSEAVLRSSPGADGQQEQEMRGVPMRGAKAAKAGSSPVQPRVQQQTAGSYGSVCIKTNTESSVADIIIFANDAFRETAGTGGELKEPAALKMKVGACDARAGGAGKSNIIRGESGASDETCAFMGAGVRGIALEGEGGAEVSIQNKVATGTGGAKNCKRGIEQVAVTAWDLKVTQHLVPSTLNKL